MRRQFANSSSIKYDPQSAGAYGWLSIIYSHIGLFDEAIQQATTLRSVSPFTSDWSFDKGAAMVWRGDYRDGLKTWQDVRLDFGLPPIRWSYTAWAHLHLEDFEGAERTFNEFSEKYHDVGGLMAGVKAIMFAKRQIRHKPGKR